jgi:hypothetical protein
MDVQSERKHDDAKSRFSQFCEFAKKWKLFPEADRLVVFATETDGEDRSQPWYNAVSAGKLLPTFREILVPSSSGSNSPIFVKILDPKIEDIICFETSVTM